MNWKHKDFFKFKSFSILFLVKTIYYLSSCPTPWSKYNEHNNIPEARSCLRSSMTLALLHHHHRLPLNYFLNPTLEWQETVYCWHVFLYCDQNNLTTSSDRSTSANLDSKVLSPSLQSNIRIMKQKHSELLFSFRRVVLKWMWLSFEIIYVILVITNSIDAGPPNNLKV